MNPAAATMRFLLGIAFLLPATGCINFTTYPEREVEFELKGAKGQPVQEWWVLSWQERYACDFGFIWGFPHGLLSGPGWILPDKKVRLCHMTADSNRMVLGGSYDWYLWYLVLIPPVGGRWWGWTSFVIVAPGETGFWNCKKGQQYPWDIFQDPKDDSWHLVATNSGRAGMGFGESGWVLSQVANHLNDLAHADPKLVDPDDLKRFLPVVIENSRANGFSIEEDEVQAFIKKMESGAR